MRWMPFRTSSQPSSPSFVLQLFKLALNESRLRTRPSSRTSQILLVCAEKTPTRADSSRCFTLITRILVRYWFLFGLAFFIAFAALLPDVARYGGYLHAEWTIKYGAVILIFLLAGMSLQTQTLTDSALRIRLHLLIQTISLVIIPFTVFGLVLLLFKLHVNMNSLLLLGMVIAASTPTTVSSNVVMTKTAGGNDATALMNAALGNLLGIFVSPALVSHFQQPLIDATPESDSVTKVGSQVNYGDVFLQLGLTVLLPLAIGQAIQWHKPDTIATLKQKLRFSDMSSFALLTLVWSVFSNAVHTHAFSAVSFSDVLFVAIINATLYIFFCGVCILLAYIPFPGNNTPEFVRKLRYSRKDTVAVMYCGATKTVAMGVPLINVLYGSNDPGSVGVLMTPLLLYHIEQLIFGNIQVDFLRLWIKRGEEVEEEEEKRNKQAEIAKQQEDEDAVKGLAIQSVSLASSENAATTHNHVAIDIYPSIAKK